MSLDGFVCGPNGEMDWMVGEWDNTITDYAVELTNSADTFLMGRQAGEGMAMYWPTVASNPESKDIEKWLADKINRLPKIVFSKTVISVNWTNTRVANDIVEEIKELKREPGKDIIVYGGAQTATYFIRENLVDEYHLFVNPVIIGKGKSIFSVADELNLKLIDTTSGASGIVILYYVSRAKIRKDKFEFDHNSTMLNLKS